VALAQPSSHLKPAPDLSSSVAVFSRVPQREPKTYTFKDGGDEEDEDGEGSDADPLFQPTPMDQARKRKLLAAVQQLEARIQLHPNSLPSAEHVGWWLELLACTKLRAQQTRAFADLAGTDKVLAEAAMGLCENAVEAYLFAFCGEWSKANCQRFLRPLCCQHGLLEVLQEATSLDQETANKDALLALPSGYLGDVLFYIPGLHFVLVRMNAGKVAWVTCCFLRSPQPSAIPKLVEGALRFLATANPSLSDQVGPSKRLKPYVLILERVWLSYHLAAALTRG
jgi:hypothetical protein